MTIDFFIAGGTSSVASVAGLSVSKNQNFGLTANLANGVALPSLTVGLAYDVEILDDSNNVVSKELAWKFTGTSYTIAEVSGVTQTQNVQLFFGK